MSLEYFLLQKKATILEHWRCFILDTYPGDSARFFKEEKDRFANPVGAIISEGIKCIYDELIGEMNSEQISRCLDNIIRVRAVQDFLPSDALAFVPFLKKVIREDLAGEIEENQLFAELLAFESRVDDIMLLTFNIYLACREQISAIRVKELRAEKDGALRLLARASSGDGKPGEE